MERRKRAALCQFRSRPSGRIQAPPQSHQIPRRRPATADPRRDPLNIRARFERQPDLAQGLFLPQKIRDGLPLPPADLPQIPQRVT